MCVKYKEIYVDMCQFLTASSSKKKKKEKRILDEAGMGQILHRNEGSLFASSLQSRSLRMLPDLAHSELSAAGGKPDPGEALLKLDLILHFSSLCSCQHQLCRVEFCQS